MTVRPILPSQSGYWLARFILRSAEDLHTSYIVCTQHLHPAGMELNVGFRAGPMVGEGMKLLVVG